MTCPIESKLIKETQSSNIDDSFPITLTEVAVKMILNTMEKEGLDSVRKWLYIGVQGGGCAGLEYIMDFSGGPLKKDWFTDEQHGLKICIDPISLTHIKGTTIDYEVGLMGSGFKFNNPLAKSCCGCEKSFS